MKHVITIMVLLDNARSGRDVNPNLRTEDVLRSVYRPVHSRIDTLKGEVFSQVVLTALNRAVP